MLTRSPTDLSSGPIPDDYIIKDDGRAIGRVLWSHSSPADRRWGWSIYSREPQKPTDRGYAATLDDALAAFKAAWEAGP